MAYGFAGSTPWFVRVEARNTVPHGMIGGQGLGRDDQLPISVPSGSYVLPADLVSGIGQGSSQAGAAILDRMFGTGPLGMPAMHAHGKFGGPTNIRMHVMKLPRGAGTGSVLNPTKAAGFQHGGAPGHTPIVAASGEYVIAPHHVLRIGRGSLERGHDVLDELVKLLRAKYVKTLQNLPGPVKRGTA
jgi:hypothetical protein